MIQEINKKPILDSEDMVISILFVPVCVIVFLVLMGFTAYDHRPSFLRNIFPP